MTEKDKVEDWIAGKETTPAKVEPATSPTAGGDKHYPTLYSEDFLKRIEELKEAIYQKHKQLSEEDTPKSEIRQRPDGYEYIKEYWLRAQLNKHFPGWSWRPHPQQPLIVGTEFVIGQGELIIIEEALLAFGINPPYRYYWGTAANRVQYRKNRPHTADNLVDYDMAVSGANSKAFKRAISRLTNIADDVYKKRWLEEEEIIEMEATQEDYF